MRITFTDAQTRRKSRRPVRRTAPGRCRATQSHVAAASRSRQRRGGRCLAPRSEAHRPLRARLPLFATTRPAGGEGRQGPRLRLLDGSFPRRRAGTCRQGRAAARAIRRRARRRSLADRPDSGGRRSGRARAASPGAAPCSRARSARSTSLFESLARGGRGCPARDRGRGASARAAPCDRGRRPRTGLGRSARFAGLRRRPGGHADGAGGEPRRAGPARSRARDARPCVSAPSSTLGAWDRGMLAPPRRRPAHERPRRLGRRARARVRVRGPDRRRVETVRGARRPAPRCTSRCPYEPGRAVFASLQRTARDLARLAGEAVRELPPGSSEYLPTVARPPRAASLRRRSSGCRSRRVDPVPRRPRAARDVRARRRGDRCSLIADGIAAGGDRGRLSLGRPRARVDRDGVRVPGGARRARRSGASSGGRRSARPCSRCSALRGLAATRRELFSFLRSPYWRDAAFRCRFPRRTAYADARCSGRANGRGDDPASGRTAASRARPRGGSASAPGRCGRLPQAMLRGATAWVRRRSRTRSPKRPARARCRPAHPRGAGADDPGAFAGSPGTT